MNNEKINVEIIPDSKAASLKITKSTSDQESIEFRTCEGVIEGNSDFGLFQLEIQEKDWSINGSSLSYSWTYEPGIEVIFNAKIYDNYINLDYQINNHTDKTLERLQIHPCLTTTNAPSFRPKKDLYSKEDKQPKYFDRRGPAWVDSESSYYELYDRLYLWNKDQAFNFKSTENGRKELHLSFMKEGEEEVEWAWWNNGKENFTEPLIALQAKDKTEIIGLHFEQSIWASSNVGDNRTCFHLFPYFGNTDSGKSKKCSGKLFWLTNVTIDNLTQHLKNL